MEYSIEFNDIVKRYRLGQSVTSIRDMVKNVGRRAEPEYHYAVNGVDFQLKRGESLGIIGPMERAKRRRLNCCQG